MKDPMMTEDQRIHEVITTANRMHRDSQKLTKLLWNSCPMCEHWDFEAKQCKLAQATPPVSVQLLGCEQFMESIPF